MSLFLFYNECFMFFIYFCESRVNNNLTYMVKMKRLFLLCAFVSMFATCNFISAQKELGIFNSVSAGVGVGLTGVDVGGRYALSGVERWSYLYAGFQH